MTCGWSRKCAVMALGALVALAAAGCASIQRVSLNAAGETGDIWSEGVGISADGARVVFSSLATNLVPGDDANIEDVFVRDLQARTTTRVSVSSEGVKGDSGSYYASISGDGRFVTFSSDATNLVPDDTNNETDIFVHDLATGETTRASVTSAGAQLDRSSMHSTLSYDGRYVAFESQATNLPGNSFWRSYRHDRTTGATDWVSTPADDQRFPNGFRTPTITADGRYVAYEGWGEHNSVFLHDMTTSDAREVASGLGRHNTTTVISADGRYIVYTGADASLLRLNVATATSDTVHSALSPPALVTAVSANGRYVAFTTEDPDVVPDDTNNFADVFAKDMQTGALVRVSTGFLNTQADLGAEFEDVNDDIGITADGRHIAFASRARNLFRKFETDVVADVFVKSSMLGVVDSVSPAQLPAGTTTTVTITGSGYVPRTLVLASDDIAVDNVTVVDANTLHADLTVPPEAPGGPASLLVILPRTAVPSMITSGVCDCLNVLP